MGLVDFQELSLGFGVIARAVRVVLDRQLAERLLDILFRGVAVDAEYLCVR